MEHNTKRETRVKIVLARPHERIETTDEVIVERPLAVYLNGQEVITLLCASSHPKDLAVGFLRSQGLLDCPDDLDSVTAEKESYSVHVNLKGEVELLYETQIVTCGAVGLGHDDPKEGRAVRETRMVTSGAGRGVLFPGAVEDALKRRVVSELSIARATVFSLMEQLSTASALHRDTGGAHSAALADASGEMILFRDDIGRHNAVDAIHGHCFLEGIPLKDKILLSTGRITSEIVVKAVMMEVPILLSLNPASSLAVDLALGIDLTVAGSIKGGKMNIYSAPARIT